jgi:anti-sigma factor RsiW
MSARGPIIPGGISCRELVELVTAYLDGALPADVAQRMDAHLQLCPPCVEYVEQVRTTTRVTAAAELELRPDRDALLSAFREVKSGD